MRAKPEPPVDESDGGPRPYRYGDFPELFWDLRPDEPVDLGHRVVVARILSDPSAANARRKLLTLEVPRRGLPRAELPPHSRDFWTRLLQAATISRLAPAPSSRTRCGSARGWTDPASDRR